MRKSHERSWIFYFSLAPIGLIWPPFFASPSFTSSLLPMSPTHHCSTCSFTTTSLPSWGRHQQQHKRALAATSGSLHPMPSLRDRIRRDIRHNLQVPFASDKARHFFYTELECSETEFFALFPPQNLLMTEKGKFVADFYGLPGKQRLDLILSADWDTSTSQGTKTFVLFHDTTANYLFRVTGRLKNEKFVCKTKCRLWKQAV